MSLRSSWRFCKMSQIYLNVFRNAIVLKGFQNNIEKLLVCFDSHTHVVHSTFREQRDTIRNVSNSFIENWCNWNTNVGHGYPGHMRSSTSNYVSARRRAFNSSQASFFVWLVNRCACGHRRFFRFCKRSEFVTSSGHADPTLWLMWDDKCRLNPRYGQMGDECRVAVKSWNSISAWFCDLVSSIQKEKVFTPIICLWIIQFRHLWYLRYIWCTCFSSKIVWH